MCACMAGRLLTLLAAARRFKVSLPWQVPPKRRSRGGNASQDEPRGALFEATAAQEAPKRSQDEPKRSQVGAKSRKNEQGCNHSVFFIKRVVFSERETFSSKSALKGEGGVPPKGGPSPKRRTKNAS